MKKLSSKILLSHILVILFLTILIILFSYRIIKSNYENNIENNLISLNSAIQLKYKDLITNNRLVGIDSLTQKIRKSIKYRISIIDINGKVISDSDEDIKNLDNHRNRPEIEEAFAGKVGKTIRFSKSINKEMIYVAMPIIIDNNIIGVCRISRYASESDKLIFELLTNLIQISIIVIIITLIGVLYYTRKITKPIDDLSIATSSIAKGDFDVKVQVNSNDEISLLSTNFNLMTEKLKELFSQVISQKEELSTIIGSIEEGLVSLNSEGRILISNEMFNKIIETESFQGKKYKKIIKEKSFKKIFKETLKSKKGITREINLKDSFFLTSSNYIESKNEVVILFHDVTEFKKLELVKKDFVTNVSHELRTPLTAIKGFLETLYNEIEDNPTALHYMNIMTRHTDRLIALVQDLLALSEIEDYKTNLVFSKINLYEFILNIIKIFEQKLNEKNLAIMIDVEDKELYIEADAFKLEQLFVNLIDNAIKYTDKGSIRISYKSLKNDVLIEIEDTGIGIPEEDKDRIFERFYLVNKARTRKEGGTGLGLSIVKHIVNNHNGTIKVESKIDVGTKFLIKLPFKQNKNL